MSLYLGMGVPYFMRKVDFRCLKGKFGISFLHISKFL